MTQALASLPPVATDPYQDIARERKALAPLYQIAGELHRAGHGEPEILLGLIEANRDTSQVIRPAPRSVLRWVAGHVVRQATYEEEQQRKLWRETQGLREVLASAIAARPDAPDRPGPNGMEARIIDLAAMLSGRGWKGWRVVKAALALNAAPQRGEWSLTRAKVRRLVKAGLAS